MTSTTLSNKSILNVLKAEIIRLKSWIIGVPCIALTASLIYSFIFVYNVEDMRRYQVESEFGIKLTNQITDITSNYLPCLLVGGTLGLMVLMLLFTNSAYRSLYDKRKVDLYGSMPITRKEYFVSKTVIGTGIIALSYLACMISVMYTSFSVKSKFAQLDSGHIARTMAVCAVLCFAVFAICTMCAVSAGKSWQYFVLALVNSFCIGRITSLPFVLYSSFVTGASAIGSAVPILVSPIESVFRLEMHVFRYRWIIVSMLAVSAAAFSAAGLIYSKRKNECAAQSISNKFIVYLTLWGVYSIVTYMIIGFLSYKYKPSEIAKTILIILAISAAVTVVGGGILCKKSFFKPAGLVQFACFFVILSVLSVTYVNVKSEPPKTDEIESVTTYDRICNYSYGYDSMLYLNYDSGKIETTKTGEYKEPNTIDSIVNLHTRIIEASKKDGLEIRGIGYERIVKYKLKDGREKTLYFDNSSYEAFEYLIKATDEYKKELPIFDEKAENLIGISLSNDIETDYSDITNKAKQYYSAFTKDLMLQSEEDLKTIYTNSGSNGFGKNYVNLYFIDEDLSKEERNRILSMPREELAKLVQSDLNEESGIIYITVDFTQNDKNIMKLLRRDGFVPESASDSEITPDNIQTIYQIDINSYDGINISNSLYGPPLGKFGKEVLARNAYDLVGSEPITDEKDIKELIEKTQFDKDQTKLVEESLAELKENLDESNYYDDYLIGKAYFAVTKDGKYSRLMFVPLEKAQLVRDYY